MRRNMWKACVASGLLSLSLAFGGIAVRADSDGVVKLPQNVAFSEAEAGKPQTAVLYGDPAKPGLYVMRLKFPAGLKVQPHTHPEEIRTLTVLSGTLYFGWGDKWDETKVTPYPPGTFFSELPTTPHFVWAKDGEVILQVAGIGPSGFIPAHLSTDD